MSFNSVRLYAWRHFNYKLILWHVSLLCHVTVLILLFRDAQDPGMEGLQGTTRIPPDAGSSTA